MKKTIIAALAALVMMPAMAKADSVVMGNDVCEVTFGSYGSGWAISQNGLECIDGVFSNRGWLKTRLETQIHYFNKVTEKLNMDHTGDNGAYWGHVTTARDMIQNLKDDKAQFKQMYQNQNAKVIVMCSDLQAAGTIPAGSEIAEICSATDTSYAGYAWEDVYGN